MKNAYEYQGKWCVQEEINSRDLNHSDSVEDLYAKCLGLSEKYGTPLSRFTMNTGVEYGNEYWYVSYERPATEEEIKYKKNQNARYKAQRRQEFERMKKEFGEK